MVVWKVSMHLSSMLFLLLGSLSSGLGFFLSMWSGESFLIEWEISLMNSCSIIMSLIFDPISLIFCSFVLLISSMVLYYSGDYMMGDKSFNRFMYLVLAFVLSMMFLIISPNLVSILLGWDGLGLVSYALVIYYQNEKSANSGMLTVLSNRVGDVAILLSIGLMLSLGGWNFMLYSPSMSDEKMGLVKALVVVAAMTKSAQIPFSAWLPAAMAAPTPVSALVHSSTLVTAGVYLLIRFSPALYGSSISSGLLILSCLTMFMAGLGANFEYDLKKIIALSTLSQLGVMMSILSMGMADLAFFHLLSHALFKALLFMCAGVIIHNVKDYQDIRSMGGLAKSMPLTSMNMILSNLALCGMPFMAGFYSKDLIIEAAFMSDMNKISFLLYILATGLTVCYTFRLIFYSLTGESNLGSLSAVCDSSKTMTSPMMLLGMGAVMSGAGLSWLLFPESYMVCLSFPLKIVALIVSLVGGSIGYLLNNMSINYSLASMKNFSAVSFMGSMWNLPLMSGFMMSFYSLEVSKTVEKTLDKGWLEHLGGQGAYFSLMKGSVYIDISQNKPLKICLKMLILWVMIVLLMVS
uniref:NADH-ubiquinone oxidoreductase chain 5 n=1 Tax=Scyllarides latus TaxID=204053 RepID=L0E779_SCYLT|nr:NADH dehydrogenase subunit 5 [Scyllarides latus]AGA56122.1 NADH dehydrogenase subunit 5 [Scyllarides latus]